MPDSDRVVFWDFDGTLARRQDRWSGALADAWRSVAAAPGVSASELRPQLRAGFPWHEPETVRAASTAEEWWAALHPLFLRAYRNVGLEPALAEQAALRVPVEFYRPDAWRVIEGAEEALRITAKAGYRNLILSNHAPELPTLVDALGLGSLVEDTITSATVGAEKPNPAIFEFAIDHAGIGSRKDVWMVGDNPIADVFGAENVGIQGILADGAYPDSSGRTVLAAACAIRDLRHPS